MSLIYNLSNELSVDPILDVVSVVKSVFTKNCSLNSILLINAQPLMVFKIILFILFYIINLYLKKMNLNIIIFSKL